VETVNHGKGEQQGQITASSPQQGQVYGDTTVSDQAIALLGNNYQYNTTYQIGEAKFLNPPDPATTALCHVGFLKKNVSHVLVDITADDDIADWLAPSHSNHQNDTFAGVQPGTGEWFLRSENYTSWLSSSGRSLVLSGIPGAGKTYLASTIINDLRRRKSIKDAYILYFYNSFKRLHEQTAVAIMSSLLRQAFLQNPALGRPVHDLFEEHLKQGRNSKPSLEELRNVLCRLVGTSSRSFLVFDALDECSTTSTDHRAERTSFLASLSSLQHETGLSIIITTRPTQEDLSLLRGLRTISIQADLGDMAAYISLRLDACKKDMFNRADLRDKVQSTILDTAGGM